MKFFKKTYVSCLLTWCVPSHFLHDLKIYWWTRVQFQFLVMDEFAKCVFIFICFDPKVAVVLVVSGLISKYCELTIHAISVWRLFSLLFCLNLGDRVIHIFKAFLILNPLISQIIFIHTVTHEAHSSLMKNNTHNLESSHYCAFPCIELSHVTTAMQSCAVMQHAGERMLTWQRCVRGLRVIENTMLKLVSLVLS